MSGLILRRLGLGVFVIWGAVSVMFLLLRLAPGNPALLLLGSDATPDEIADLTERLGLDRPGWEQYFTYLGQVASLDFGTSFRYSMPAMDVVLSRLPATVLLTLSATVLAVVVGLSLGILAGRRPGGLVDRITSGVTILLQSMPTFWVGIMFILLFALTLRVLPSAGIGSPAQLVLPSVTLALPFIAIVARVTRSSLAESMGESYVQTAFAKGLTRGEVVRGHALRNSLAPVIAVVGLQVGALLGGAVIVENVFAWPGLGTLIIQAVQFRDYSVVQAAVLLIAAIVLVLNLMADIAYAVVDPRVRRGAVRA